MDLGVDSFGAGGRGRGDVDPEPQRARAAAADAGCEGHALAAVADAAECVVREGLTAAMNRFNKKVAQEPSEGSPEGGQSQNKTGTGGDAAKAG